MPSWIKRVLLFLFLFVIVLIAGCKGCTRDSDTDKSGAGEAAAGAVLELACGALSGLNKDHCYKRAATMQNDVNVCDKIEGKSAEKGIAPKNQCYNDIAVLNGDPTMCGKIHIPFDQLLGVSTTQDKCLQSVGIKNKDYDTCMKIGREQLKEQCLKAIGSDLSELETRTCDPREYFKDQSWGCVCRPEYPLKLKVEEKVQCYTVSEYIEHKGHVLGCDQTKDLLERTRCIKALATRPRDCLSAKDALLLQDCFVTVAKTASDCNDAYLLGSVEKRVISQQEQDTNYQACMKKFALTN